jgi:hypothetical protein
MNASIIVDLQILAALFVYSLVMAILLVKSIIFGVGLAQDRNPIGVKLLGYALLITGWVAIGWLSILALKALRMQ